MANVCDRSLRRQRASKKDNICCLICNDADTQDGFDITYTILPRSGALLSNKISSVLCCNVNNGDTISKIICHRCFSLFEELSIAEERCTDIKREVRQYFSSTTQLHNLEEPTYDGISRQTQTDLTLENIKDEEKDTKRNRGSSSKRRCVTRGSSTKGYTTYTSLDTVSSENGLPAESIENGDNNEDDKVEVKKKLTGGCGIVDLKKEVKDEFDSSIKEETSLAQRIRIYRHAKSRKRSSSPEWLVEKHENGVSEDEKREFSLEFYNCDDDFEWKEEQERQKRESRRQSQPSQRDDPLASSGSDNSSAASSSDESDDSSRKLNSRSKKKKKNSKRKGETRRRVEKKNGKRKNDRCLLPPIHECPQCGKKWRTQAELKAHVATHSDLRPYVCEMCGQAYKMKRALDVHIGMHNGIHPYVCSHCNKSFTQKVGLEKHLPIHTGVTRYQCDLCGKGFIHQKSFNIHKMTHTGEKNVRCPQCDLAVFSRSHLKRHFRVHTGERPYACDICGKKFAEKYNLNAHKKIHIAPGSSRRRNFRCPVCGEACDKKDKMMLHLASAHYMWNMEDLKKQQGLTDCVPTDSSLNGQQDNLLAGQQDNLLATTQAQNYSLDLTPTENMNHHQIHLQIQRPGTSESQTIVCITPSTSLHLTEQHNADQISSILNSEPTSLQHHMQSNPHQTPSTTAMLMPDVQLCNPPLLNHHQHELNNAVILPPSTTGVIIYPAS